MHVVKFVLGLDSLIGCCLAWDSTSLRWVYFVFLGCMADCFPCDCDFQEDLPVAFLNVDNSEAMNFLVSNFFLDHEIVHCGPSGQDMTFFCADFGDEVYDFEDVLRS